MAVLKLHKVVSSLPGSLEANSIYFVRVGAGFDLYVTNDIGTVVAYALNTSGGGSSGSIGVGEVDFGAGETTATLTVTGQAAILATSFVEAHVAVKATTDHTADEHWVEELDVSAGNIVPGVGFTIYAKTRNLRLFGKYTIAWQWR